jgi:excisionase family DNA binding protein
MQPYRRLSREGDGGQGCGGVDAPACPASNKLFRSLYGEPESQLRRLYQIILTNTTINATDFDKYISQAEAARLIGVTKQTLAHLVAQNRFTTKVVAGRVLVLRSDVEKYVARPKGRPRKGAAEKAHIEKPVKTLPKSDEKYISQAEAARLRGVSEQAIANLIQRNRLSFVKVARRTLLLRSEVETFVAKPLGRPPKRKAKKEPSKKVKPKNKRSN